MQKHKLSDYLAAGHGSWFFLFWAIILIGNAAYNFANGFLTLGQFWAGAFLFYLAIIFCPCYAAKTCRVLGIKR